VWLARARERGEVLTLTARLEDLDGVRTWLAGRRGLERLSDVQVDLVSTAVYEACTNIIEHGYHNDTQGIFRVWWIAEDGGSARLIPGSQPVRGAFVILDQGERFSGDAWTSTDFSDSRVWRRGRGFGLDIIHAVMSRVRYCPGTAEGNVMILHFDEADLAIEEKDTTHEDSIGNQVG
jgi:anti-sigma regulatory factor (Ser/Thr protein kinase)